MNSSMSIGKQKEEKEKNKERLAWKHGSNGSACGKERTPQNKISEREMAKNEIINRCGNMRLKIVEGNRCIKNEEKRNTQHKQTNRTHTGDGGLVLLGDRLTIDELCKDPLADLASRQDSVDGDSTFRGKCESWIIGIGGREIGGSADQYSCLSLSV